MLLSARRFLNLIYFFFRQRVEHDEEKLREFERNLEQGYRADGRPAWFDDDADATRSSMAAAAALGLKI